MRMNFILSKMVGQTHYLCSEATPYIGSGEGNKANNIEEKERNK